jgi:hypothetical protein
LPGRHEAAAGRPSLQLRLLDERLHEIRAETVESLVVRQVLAASVARNRDAHQLLGTAGI